MGWRELRPLWTWPAAVRVPVKVAATTAAVWDLNVISIGGQVRWWGVLGLAVVVTVAAETATDPGFARYTRAERRAAAEAYRTGLATGEPAVDQLVRGRLAQAVRGRTAYLVVGSLLIAALVVAAAVRGGPLWLLTAVPLLVLFLPEVPSWVIDPVGRLERFEATAEVEA